MSRVTGLLLAAGAGLRMGQPKALVVGDDGVPWVARGVGTLLDGGCDAVVVVLGASAEQARALVPVGSRTEVHVATDWREGVGASLRSGLAWIARDEDGDPDVDAVLVSLVDLPGMPSSAVARLLDVPAPRGALRQAVYGTAVTVPGHPVLLGRDHWAALGAVLRGDRGAGGYLVEQGAERVPCDDLWDGADRDALGGQPASVG